MSEQRAKVLIVVFDGLRPDMVTPELTPQLCRLRALATWFRASRSVFPSMTRAATTSFATGSPPGVHGVVANSFFDPRVFPAEALDGGRREHLEAAEAAYGGRFVTAVSLGERLAAAGRRMVTVHTGSPGAAFLINHKAAANPGHATFSVHGPAASTPDGVFGEVVGRFGPVPPAGVPNSARMRYATNVLLERVLGEERPDVAVIWYSEPDVSYHYGRIGSAETRGALAAVDAEFGRILDWWRTAPGAGAYRLFAISDHAQITAHTQIDLLGELGGAGFGAGLRLEAERGAFGLTPGYSAALVLLGRDERRLAEAAAWLQRQPWCGLTFSAAGRDGDGVEGRLPGTFALGLVQAEHARSPDMVFTLRADDGPDPDGWPGGCCFTGGVPVGGGMHGGLHPMELNNLFMLAGEGIRQGLVTARPAGLIDVAPTALRLLGLDAPPTMTGRVVAEAFEREPFAPPEAEAATFEAGHGDYRQQLSLRRVGGTTYIERGWTA